MNSNFIKMGLTIILVIVVFLLKALSKKRLIKLSALYSYEPHRLFLVRKTIAIAFWIALIFWVFWWVLKCRIHKYLAFWCLELSPQCAFWLIQLFWFAWFLLSFKFACYVLLQRKWSNLLKRLLILEHLVINTFTNDQWWFSVA